MWCATTSASTDASPLLGSSNNYDVRGYAVFHPLRERGGMSAKSRSISAAHRHDPSSSKIPASASAIVRGGPSALRRTYPSSGGRSFTGYGNSTMPGWPRNGQIEHFSGDRLPWRIRERLLGGTHLVVVVERRSRQSLVERADEHGPNAPKEDRLRDRGDFGLAHALSDQCEGFVGAPVRRFEVIGLVEIEIVDIVEIDERGDGERPVALRNDGRDFVPTNKWVLFGHHFASIAGPAGSVLTSPAAQAIAAGSSPALIEDESMVDIAQIEGQMRASSLRRIGDLVDKHPDETLSIVRGWMVQESN